MTEFLIAYTGPRGGKPKYVTVTAETAHDAAEKFIDYPGRFTGDPRQKEVYIQKVYAPVEWLDTGSVRKGHAKIDPFEPVTYDQARADRGLPPWRNGACTRFYLDPEVKTID